MDEDSIKTLMQDTAKAAGMEAKKQLATYVRLLPMIVNILAEIAEHLTQIATAIAIANGVKDAADGDKGEDGGL